MCFELCSYIVSSSRNNTRDKRAVVYADGFFSELLLACFSSDADFCPVPFNLSVNEPHLNLSIIHLHTQKLLWAGGHEVGISKTGQGSR
jgi:hypothetical protein